MIKLAIIIPYYKPQFFREALLSVKNQTDQRFHLYIGDDCSPHDPQEIIKDVFGDVFNDLFTYCRFDENTGKTALTKQWERCIELAHEPYTWLFSDDDIMPDDAVERFYQFIKKEPGAELIRFNINMIDDKGAIINTATEHPVYETAKAFLERRLRGDCISAACEYIFKKTIYFEQGGFVELPLAWASDDATWLNFAQNKGIYTIPGKQVLWRFGSFSISANTANYKEKIRASLLFIKFIRAGYVIDINLQLHWLFFQLGLLNKSAKVRLYFFYELFYSRMFSFSSILFFVSRKIAKRVFAK